MGVLASRCCCLKPLKPNFLGILWQWGISPNCNCNADKPSVVWGAPSFRKLTWGGPVVGSFNVCVPIHPLTCDDLDCIVSKRGSFLHVVNSCLLCIKGWWSPAIAKAWFPAGFLKIFPGVSHAFFFLHHEGLHSSYSKTRRVMGCPWNSKGDRIVSVL